MTGWERVLAGPHDGAGTWAPLPENGWGALVAFLTGPGRVRTVPHEYGPVTVVCERDGERVTWQEPITDEEIRKIESDNASYLAEYGVPAPPSGVRFEVRVPDGTDEGDLARALLEATMREVPGIDPPAERRVMERVLATYLRD